MALRVTTRPAEAAVMEISLPKTGWSGTKKLAKSLQINLFYPGK
jgi:hypothetical protein